MDSKDVLLYWIRERERIRRKKEAGEPKPWSVDPVFQNTYFCNVRREDDKVTRWIRKFYSPYVADPMFEFNIILARFLNWPSTLEQIGYVSEYNYDHADALESQLEMLAAQGKIWGNAYVVTTHGIPMAKTAYLANKVMMGYLAQREALGAVFVGGQLQGCRPTLTRVQGALMRLEGIGSFMAGQVIADLKNTPGHPLQAASDWMTFVAPGPGSIRGCSWFSYDDPKTMGAAAFPRVFPEVREFVDDHWAPVDMGPPICNQDLQNCLCEYDKYMRVKQGTGRSKRIYHGS